jgi:hypothetical protein
MEKPGSSVGVVRGLSGPSARVVRRRPALWIDWRAPVAIAVAGIPKIVDISE